MSLNVTTHFLIYEGEIGGSKAPEQCLLAAPKRLSILKASEYIGGGIGHAWKQMVPWSNMCRRRNKFPNVREVKGHEENRGKQGAVSSWVAQGEQLHGGCHSYRRRLATSPRTQVVGFSEVQVDWFSFPALEH